MCVHHQLWMDLWLAIYHKNKFIDQDWLNLEQKTHPTRIRPVEHLQTNETNMIHTRTGHLFLTADRFGIDPLWGGNFPLHLLFQGPKPNCKAKTQLTKPPQVPPKMNTHRIQPRYPPKKTSNKIETCYFEEKLVFLSNHSRKPLYDLIENKK